MSRERKKVSHLADLRLSCVQILQTLTIVARTTGVFPTVILNAIVQTVGGATINNLCQGGQSDQTNFDGLSGSPVRSPNDGGGQRREVQVKDVVVLPTRAKKEARRYSCIYHCQLSKWNIRHRRESHQLLPAGDSGIIEDSFEKII